MDQRNIDAEYNDANQVMMLGGGITLVSFVIIGVLGEGNPLGELLTLVFLGGIGIFVYGLSQRKLINRYEMYYSLLTEEHVTSVYQLASMSGEPVQKTIKRLRKINEKGWMKVYVNEMDGSIHYNANVKKEPEDKKTTSTKLVTIYCQTCGGKNVIQAGTTSSCKYCGDVIVDESYVEPEYKEPEQPKYENINSHYDDHNDNDPYESNHEYYKRQEQAYYQRYNSNVSDKDKMVALLLCIFLGAFGAHRYYVGKVGTGVLYTFTAGLMYIGWFYDIYAICTGKFTDKYGRVLQ